MPQVKQKGVNFLKCNIKYVAIQNVMYRPLVDET